MLWHNHAEGIRKADVECFPLQQKHFESSSGIPFLSLPNMGGIVRKQVEECERAVEPTQPPSDVRRSTEPHTAWKFTGRNVRNSSSNAFHSGMFVKSLNHTHLPLYPPHTHTHIHMPSCNMFHQSSHWGDISSRKVLFPSLTLPLWNGESYFPASGALCEAPRVNVVFSLSLCENCVITLTVSC